MSFGSQIRPIQLVYCCRNVTNLCLKLQSQVGLSVLVRDLSSWVSRRVVRRPRVTERSRVLEDGFLFSTSRCAIFYFDYISGILTRPLCNVMLNKCTGFASTSTGDHFNLVSDFQNKMPKRKTKKQGNHPKKVQKFAHEDQFSNVEYYFENGLRKVKPYVYKFETHAKGRWFGCKLLDVFRKEFRLETPEYYEVAIKEGLIRVNKAAASPDRILRNNDFMQSKVHRHEPPVSGEPIQIIADTEDYLVINKPASIPVHPCGKYRRNTLVFILGREYGFRGLHTIHRLDRLTSGLLLFARTREVSLRLDAYVRDRRLEKIYVCKVQGEFPSEPVECAEPIFIVSHKIGVCRVKADGKPCHTRFERLSYDGETSIIKCFPLTGRMHQIRVHLQYLGYPIINDPLYNNPVWGPDKGKGGLQGRTDEQLLKDLIEQHDIEIDAALEKARIQNLMNVKQTADHGDDSTAHGNEGTAHNNDNTAHDNDSTTHGNNDLQAADGRVTSRQGGDSLRSCTSGDSRDSEAVLSVNHLPNRVVPDDTIHSDQGLDAVDSTSVATLHCTASVDDRTNQDASGKTCGSLLSGDDATMNNPQETPRTNHSVLEETRCHQSSGSLHGREEAHILSADCKPDEIVDKGRSGKNDGDGDATQADAKPERGALYKECHKSQLMTADIETSRSDDNATDTDRSSPPVCRASVSPEDVSGGGVKETVARNNKVNDDGDDDDEIKERLEDERTDKLVVTLCRECRDPMPDPEPHEMCIYLHALTYKGPDFEFTTPMPSWAVEHFNRTGIEVT
ncbi:uncharacterized protein [Diadema setosum]|uniref:uncharacterized protein n=1 Tax=Diadema setosum TaxID=31175 RepID=UPI003B3BAF24